ncbi:MAG: glycosyltransferase [Melioribacteraceae bacterium]|nr:glycosyltransferase [Melioribacteraceae bacterium]MCF8263388.1 glycosyltransferase [Melioribacteraceae bacterium]MCF8430874.1 glycosyltransferase [Melioribacteraceae bacterium]
MDIKVLAIRTDFKHHGENHGYKQILKGIKPKFVLGINERDPEEKIPTVFKKYQWLFEFKAKKYENEIDILHILYGEDYFRWSARLFKKVPIVVTFHQPADSLEQEILHGNLRGRIGKITHQINKNRFQKISAAIVTNISQKEILTQVMDAEKIFVVPLGIQLDELNALYKNRPKRKESEPTLITIGNWLRDWDFYFKIVEKCPDWNFQIINRSLGEQYKNLCESFPNVRYFENVDDDKVNELLLEADLQFLPVTGMAASNALIQGLGLGCPLVLTETEKDNQYNSEMDFIKLYKKGDTEDCINRIKSIVELRDNEKNILQDKANLYAQNFSWHNITQKTIDIYKSIIK